jgi:hypothetical protein
MNFRFGTGNYYSFTLKHLEWIRCWDGFSVGTQQWNRLLSGLSVRVVKNNFIRQLSTSGKKFALNWLNRCIEN